MENILVYQEYSETIRQIPQNYLIAHKEVNRWVCEPDLAADKELASRVFVALFDFDTKYGDGLNLLSKVTPNSNFKKVTIQSIKEEIGKRIEQNNEESFYSVADELDDLINWIDNKLNK